MIRMKKRWREYRSTFLEWIPASSYHTKNGPNTLRQGKKNIIAERYRLGMLNGNKNRVDNIPMDTTIQASAINKLKSNILLLDSNNIHDTNEAAAEKDKGEKDPSVLFGVIISNYNN